MGCVAAGVVQMAGVCGYAAGMKCSGCQKCEGGGNVGGAGKDGAGSGDAGKGGAGSGDAGKEGGNGDGDRGEKRKKDENEDAEEDDDDDEEEEDEDDDDEDGDEDGPYADDPGPDGPPDGHGGGGGGGGGGGNSLAGRYGCLAETGVALGGLYGAQNGCMSLWSPAKAGWDRINPAGLPKQKSWSDAGQRSRWWQFQLAQLGKVKKDRSVLPF